MAWIDTQTVKELAAGCPVCREPYRWENLPRIADECPKCGRTLDDWPLRIVRSGAQTGADQAALVVGKRLGYHTAGMVPKGRRTEVGALTDQEMAWWGLTESHVVGYDHRTRENIERSDGTVLFALKQSPGSHLTKKLCRLLGKPLKINPTAGELREWIRTANIVDLNVAGNRESVSPGIFALVSKILEEAL